MSESSIIIAPSILAADFGNLQAEVDAVGSADWVQADVMDGHFVPNLSFGAPVLRCIRTDLPLDVHLMVENPEERLEEFLALSPAHITFHAEVTDTLSREAIIAAIRDGGATAGIALNPQTPLEEIDDIVDDVDLVLLMSVQPGFGGQEFRPEVLDKVRRLRERHPSLMIQMDGGIDRQTAPQCIAAGANNLVSGSYIFKSDDRAAAIASLRST